MLLHDVINVNCTLYYIATVDKTLQTNETIVLN